MPQKKKKINTEEHSALVPTKQKRRHSLCLMSQRRVLYCSVKTGCGCPSLASEPNPSATSQLSVPRLDPKFRGARPLPRDGHYCATVTSLSRSPDTVRVGPRPAGCRRAQTLGLQAETHQPLSWPYCQERSRPDSETRASERGSERWRRCPARAGPGRAGRGGRAGEEGVGTREPGRRAGRGRDVKTASRR